MDVLGGDFSMPLGGAHYGPPPWLLRGADAIMARYEADAALVRTLLPSGVELLDDLCSASPGP